MIVTRMIRAGRFRPIPYIHRWALLLLPCFILLAGCARSVSPVPSATPAASSALFTATAPPTSTTAPTATPSPSPTTVPPTATPTPPPAACSPLEGIAYADLTQPDLLKGTFQAPRPGMDDGHQGIDLAFWSRGQYKTMLGLPVHSMLNGTVAGVILNRPPYGNAVIIETPLDDLPRGWLPEIPAPAPTVQPAPNLLCPPDPVDYAAHPGRSLYLLYAHFNLPPLVSTGQPVTCGQPIGEVGTTGASVNPHLHLETRAGPAGATFSSMSHYTTAASEVERRTYCTWRLSGLFQMFDPIKLLSLQP